jgi:hypothetical protein
MCILIGMQFWVPSGQIFTILISYNNNRSIKLAEANISEMSSGGAWIESWLTYRVS